MERQYARYLVLHDARVRVLERDHVRPQEMGDEILQSLSSIYYANGQGLGTSTAADAKIYFSDLDKHLKEFHAMQEGDKELIELAFSKKKADDRKEWLRTYRVYILLR